MPRFYDIVRPSTNKAAVPGQERKGSKPPVSPKSEEDKKAEGGRK